MRWLFFLTPVADGPSNMALDEALMTYSARTGVSVFRIYGWDGPTLSLGRNQRARGFYDETVARRLGIAFVRRPTGGRALLHHREVTYGATLPAARSADSAVAYDFINGVLLSALRRLGVNAGPPPPARSVSLPPGLRPCFDVPSEHEIAVDGRKLVGSAQWRHDGAVLQHGSILVRDDQHLVGQLLSTPFQTPSPTPPAATLSDALGYEPSIEQVAQTILESLEVATGSAVERFVPDRRLEVEAERRRATYADPSWTWRR